MIKEKSKTWQSISLKLGQCFSPLPFSPVFYTLASFLLSFVAIIFSYLHDFKWAIVLFVIASVLDVVDGAVARNTSKDSNLGAFLDGTIDRFVDFAIIFSYFFFDIQVTVMPIEQLICIASFVVIVPSFIVAYANHRKAVEDDTETLIWRIMNRGEMLVMMIGVLVFSLFNPVWAGYCLILLIVLSVITILQTMFETIYYAKTLSVNKKAPKA